MPLKKLTISENFEKYSPEIQETFEKRVLENIENIKTRICQTTNKNRKIDIGRRDDRAYLRLLAKKRMKTENLFK